MMSISRLWRNVASVALTVGSIGLPRNADACRCLELSSPAAAYRGADAVVIGSVASITPRPDIDGVEVTLDVKKVWKDDVPAKIRVTTGTTCAFSFAPSGSYLLFLQRIPDGVFTTGRCMGNRELTKANSFLSWLNENARVGKTSETAANGANRK